MSEQIKSSFSKAKDNDAPFVDEDKLGNAGVSQAEFPKTSTPSVDGKRKPMMFPNVGTGPFHFQPLLIMGKVIHLVGLSSKLSETPPPP